MTGSPVIEVEHVCAGYDTALLDDVSFQVNRGEVFVILGGSGCGKSTLLKHLIGLIPPLGGTIRLMGDRLFGSPEAERERAMRRFGVTYQSGALFGSMTLLENVCLPLESFTALPREARDLLAEMKLDLVGLKAFADFFPADISGGMKKRAAIARAMALDPEILFLDEPSAGLDPVTSAELDRLILQLRDTQGVTVVMVTHELASIHAVADRCVMLDKTARGIIAEGPPAELRDRPPNATVRAFFQREGNRTGASGSHEVSK
ncbi:MAG TPA: ATP-binding cassette domain-containing protein [Kiritimatiellia bacterium]|jgi:phospholipid/cholesterol/gamma-HCH transport system ATP-binding protein|nr:ATP-binding cassette domain-containing protein [Kiritimatiellia bacterium]HOM59429.1 ATP-binding cassette domain-containing protein [Kiritimatiellia bacterium]HOR98748.1 ATP-binding cassette domain-containing protein [Kiritimatiellia bacterium]HPC49703.1 ATP-binding cassette domain-containing protein [Kiritimatiellia bacterium]HPK37675.1 ATP-binding cassette domain-containing protein [Kiritimatiellia bacterium]